MIRVFEAFAGYGSQSMALERLKQDYPQFDYEVVGISEIDKYAIKAYNATHEPTANYGDICLIDWNSVPDFDLFTYSFPCTDISSAGRQKGFEEGSGTRSSLLWECRKAIEAKRPKYLLMENVKALVSQKFLPYFLKWQNELASYGYTNFAKVLNARDFGIPQNRKRIFMVSILDENASYHFPEPFHLDKRLKDVLEEDVDEKYYLSKKIIDTFIERNKINEDKGNGFKFKPTDGDCVASSVLTMPGSRPCDNYIQEPIACAMRGREVYGNKHVNNIIESGKIPADEVAFLDGYNQTVHTDVTATIKTRIDKGNFMFVSIPQCLTTKRTEYGKKVRKEYESGELKESRHNMQQLEPREDGVCNTITSVQKDNLIIVPKIVQKARGFNKGGEHEISPTISSNSWECNNILIESKILSYTRDANGKVVDRHFKDVANTIHGATGGGGNTDNYVVEPFIPEPSKMIGVSVHPLSRKMEFKGAESIKSDASPTLRATDYKCPPTLWEMDEESCGNNLSSGYRIRKLTPREVFRLMDVDDADIDKIQSAGISNSQQYKMAGNSIVVDVLYYIFKNLFIEKPSKRYLQLKLF